MRSVVEFRHKGSFTHLDKFFKTVTRKLWMARLEEYGRKGVEALRNATPVNSGKTADSWGFQIEETDGAVSINWTNSNVNHGVNIAVILQYGHGTGTGGYVQGIDYINPALAPIFQAIADDAWKEVISA